MRNLNSRVRKLENANGFRNEAQRQEYLQYARRINPGVTRDDIRSEKDYINLLKSHLSPLPHEQAYPAPRVKEWDPEKMGCSAQGYVKAKMQEGYDAAIK